MKKHELGDLRAELGEKQPDQVAGATRRTVQDRPGTARRRKAKAKLPVQGRHGDVHQALAAGQRKERRGVESELS
eukprot:7008361-Heterocapsa_arctica.AAC.2